MRGWTSQAPPFVRDVATAPPCVHPRGLGRRAPPVSSRARENRLEDPRMRIAHALACLALLGLGGCTLFGGEEEGTAGQAEAPVSVIPAPQSVIAVRRVELGRTR